MAVDDEQRRTDDDLPVPVLAELVQPDQVVTPPDLYADQVDIVPQPDLPVQPEDLCATCDIEPEPDELVYPDVPPDELVYPDVPPDVGPLPPGCQVFDGGCDDGLPEEPWWYFDGDDCLMEDTCVCEGCPGTFATKEQCEVACFGEVQPDECPEYVSALMDCPHYLHHGFQPDACVQATCMEQPCTTDADCEMGDGAFFAPYCVLGSCAFCWQDTQCSGPQECRGGRCVEPAQACPILPPCTDFGCKLIHPSEYPCPVCLCDSIYGVECEEDFECMLYSFHPFKRCVYGRCGDCTSDDDCTFGSCLPPGICYQMEPPVHTLYGTWLIGWWGAMNHYSYFRFEPDGTLRRGTYEPEGAWADDIPQAMPCWPGIEPPPYPLVGTWEPEVTQSGFLVVRMNLNIECDSGEGWEARYVVNPTADGTGAVFDDVDSDWTYDGLKADVSACTPDFSICETPSLF